MAKGGNNFQTDLDSQDDGVVLKALERLKRTEGLLDGEDTESLIPRCLDKLQHHDIAIRANAIGVIAGQLRVGNTGMVNHTTNMAKKLALPNVLDLKMGEENGESFQNLHKDVCYTITEMQEKFPEMLMPNYKPIGHYLVQCTCHGNYEIATMACEHWATLGMPPVPPSCMDIWLPTIMKKLTKLVPALLKAMIYKPEHVEFLQKNSGTRTPEQMESHTNKRNFAALGFENICQIFQQEVTAIFRQYLERWVDSENWLEREAIFLAFSAFTQALGTPRELKDMYPTIMPKLLAGYTDENPLIRSITCFTMQQFINIKMKGVKDPFSKIVKNTIHLLNDSCAEVQEMALRCMATALAYAERDISSHGTKIIDALLKANTSITGKTRYPYYESIGHLFGRMHGVLSEEVAQKLLDPLIEHWQQLNWRSPELNSDEDTLMLCQPLCTIAKFARSEFSQHIDVIFQKIVPCLEKIVENPNKFGIKEAEEVISGQMVAYIDLLSAMFEGQGESSDMTEYVDKYNLVPCVMSVLTCAQLKDEVHQSALALLGNNLHLCYTSCEPHLDGIMDILDKTFTSKKEGVKNNTMWVLSLVAKSSPNDNVPNERLLQYSNRLGAVVAKFTANQGAIMNAAIALTNLGGRWPKEVFPTVNKHEVFNGLCFLLQNQFPVESEKVTMYTNFCAILGPYIKKVHRENWIQFCVAAAVLDVQNGPLEQKIKAMLRDVRVAMGNTGWNKISQLMGSQLAYSLRKKYKFY